MNDGTLRRIAWRRIFPWILLFRLPRLATRVPLLLLGAIAMALLPLGWQAAAWVCFPGEDIPPRQVAGEWILSPSPPHDFLHPQRLLEPIANYGVRAFTRRLAWWTNWLSSPPPPTTAAYLCLGLLWSLSVWSFFGAAISRIALADLGCHKRVGFGESISFAARRVRAVITAPLMPFAAFVVLGLAPLLVGVVSQMPSFGELLAGLLWLLILPIGVLMTLIAYGLFFGWPLMAPVIAAERNGDSFEALSRAYAYCTQRPFHLLLYALFASVLGGATWVLVDAFAQTLLHLTAMGAVWGDADPSIVRGLNGWPTRPDERFSLFAFWRATIELFAAGFHFSFFWCAASAVYLMLRRHVDETNFDELDVGDGSPPLPLPEIVDPSNEATTHSSAAATDTSVAEAGSSAEPPQSSSADAAESGATEENPSGDKTG